MSDSNGSMWVLLLLPVGLALLHHRPLTWMVELAEKAMKRKLDVRIPPWSESLKLIALYLPAWVLIGTATWCVARAFDPSVSWLTIAPAAMLSWVVGFVLVPVPGGVGVREAAFVALVGGTVPSGVRATIAVVARLAFMLVDALGALIGAAVVRRWDAASPPSLVTTEPDG
jgi:uncharacterized membrane protein YbhN (UPF0104 family)